MAMISERSQRCGLAEHETAGPVNLTRMLVLGSDIKRDYQSTTDGISTSCLICVVSGKDVCNETRKAKTHWVLINGAPHPFQDIRELC